jgi:hypothetical protein
MGPMHALARCLLDSELLSTRRGVSPWGCRRRQVRIAESWRLMALMYMIYAIQVRLVAEGAGSLKAVLRGAQQAAERV